MATVAVRSKAAVEEPEEGWVDDSNPLLNFLSRFGAAPAWVASLAIHVVMLMMLSMVVYYPPTNLLQSEIRLIISERIATYR